MCFSLLLEQERQVFCRLNSREERFIHSWKLYPLEKNILFATTMKSVIMIYLRMHSLPVDLL